MTSRTDVINAVLTAAKSQHLSARADRVKEIGVGGYQIVFTFKPLDAPKVDPFKVGTVFQLGRRTYEVTGQNLRKWKYPVRVKRLPDGRGFCASAESVIDGFLYVRGK